MELFIKIIEFTNDYTHRHKWGTTHTNKWQHPTRQKCKCGLNREFRYKSNEKEIAGMPWDKGEWIWSNGDVSNYQDSYWG